MAIEMLTSLSGNFNSQSFDIDHEGVTTNVASKYSPIPGAENVISEVAAEVKDIGPDVTADLTSKVDFSPN